MDLLNLSRPWDCESFPKSKTICYGGGGGGGGSVGDNPIVKKVAKETGYTGSDLDKAGQATEKAVTGGVKKAATTVDKWADQSGLKDSGKVDYGARFGNFTESVKKGASSTIESVKKDVAQSDIGKATSAGIENIKKEGTKATEHIKKETQKLASGDYSLKKSIQGTASGASETFKKSDVGKTVKTIADKSGYTGSDFDKSMQKVEKEGANIANQALDVVDQPGKYVAGKVEEFKQYAAERFGYADKDEKKTAKASAKPASPGSDKTMGQGNIEGLKGGGSLAASERSRIRQNKRKLRIART